MTISQAAGILPAIIFPAATLAQLLRMIRHRSTAGVSAATWLLFGVANLAIYVYAERYAEWQAIVGMLLTALLDFIIVGVALVGFRAEANHAEDGKSHSAAAGVARGAVLSARH
ncbi:MAG TPA: hypothetical protein VHD62_07220 [Opitutaceae bacterium]|nr:hypothetical protein [Opitutaceae bacterium]